MNENIDCHCGSGVLLEHCCQPIITGDVLASTAEALMRSRYTAYIQLNSDYLRKSWSCRTCPKDLDCQQNLVWQSLKIVKTQAGLEQDKKGIVEFVASYKVGGVLGELHEISRFVRENNCWVYLDGDTDPQSKKTISRNSPCPCGSGKKFKRCCG
ncbi:MAG: YchJ family protein [Methylococcales bacterium]|jgi:SEC-C motif domain protein|nr:YchJ family protein [Methylococcales bacterium]